MRPVIASRFVGVGMFTEEGVACVLRWCVPVLFSLLDGMDVLRLLGAVITEHKVGVLFLLSVCARDFSQLLAYASICIAV